MAQTKLVAVRIDDNLCVGSGMCVATHPERFAFKSDGHATYVARVLDDAAAREAEELCPVSAISLVFEDKDPP